jgi:hypothetical protein
MPAWLRDSGSSGLGAGCAHHLDRRFSGARGYLGLAALDEGVDVSRAGRSGGPDRRGLGGEDPPPCPDAP